MHDVVIVGAGPVGATLALMLADADLDVVLLDARPAGESLRGDRALALSHGARLVFERIGVWQRLEEAHGALTPIMRVDISERGRFGRTTLEADEIGLPALGYVVAYRHLQEGLDRALAGTRLRVRHGITAGEIGGTVAYAAVQVGTADPVLSRLVVVADGAGAGVPAIARLRHAYDQSALIARLSLAETHGGLAIERFTPDGPAALLPQGEDYGLVWTTTPARAHTLAGLDDDAFLRRLSAHLGGVRHRFTAVHDRRVFPLALEIAPMVAATRTVVIGNAAQALHPIGGQGFNLGLRDAYALGTTLRETPAARIGDHRMLSAYAAKRRSDRWGGVLFTNGLLAIFGSHAAPLGWARGMALAALDVAPPVKRLFTRAMLFGLR